MCSVTHGIHCSYSVCMYNNCREHEFWILCASCFSLNALPYTWFQIVFIYICALLYCTSNIHKADVKSRSLGLMQPNSNSNILYADVKSRCLGIICPRIVKEIFFNQMWSPVTLVSCSKNMLHCILIKLNNACSCAISLKYKYMYLIVTIKVFYIQANI